MKPIVALPFRHQAGLVCGQARQMLIDAGFELICNETGDRLSREDQKTMIKDAYAIIAGTVKVKVMENHRFILTCIPQFAKLYPDVTIPISSENMYRKAWVSPLRRRSPGRDAFGKIRCSSPWMILPFGSAAICTGTKRAICPLLSGNSGTISWKK